MRGHSLAEALRDTAGTLRDGGFFSDRFARALDVGSDFVESAEGRPAALAAAATSIVLGVAAIALAVAALRIRLAVDDVEAKLS